MPARARDYGFRTSIQIHVDDEKLIQRARATYKKTYGYAPSRSAMVAMAIRGFFKRPDWLESSPEKGATNGQ